MSIIIDNITVDFTTEGPDTYILRINEQAVTTFEHDHKDGLPALLQRAADAVRIINLNDLPKLVSRRREGRHD